MSEERKYLLDEVELAIQKIQDEHGVTITQLNFEWMDCSTVSGDVDCYLKESTFSAKAN